MRQRWLGLTLLGLAVFIGTPIAISFIEGAQVNCPAIPEFPPNRSGEDWRFLDRGALVRDRVVDETLQSWWRRHGQGSPLSVRWEFSESRVRVNIPIWPLPIALAVAGAGCLWLARGRVKIARGATLGDRALVALTIGAAIATSSVLVLSFVASGGVYVVWSVIQDRVRIHAIGVDRGALFAEYWPDANQQSHSPVEHRGPMNLRLHRVAGSWQVTLPFWPLPFALFGASWWLHRRGTRSQRWAAQGRCHKCGYSLAGLGVPACPECGVDAALEKKSASLPSE